MSLEMGIGHGMDSSGTRSNMSLKVIRFVFLDFFQLETDSQIDQSL